MFEEEFKKLNNLTEEYLVEMARIGWVPTTNVRGIEVYVRTDDGGKIPHFHIRKYGDNNTFDWETCVKYTSAEYFKHGNYKDNLPSGFGKKLNTMLKQNNPKDPGRTYWQSAIIAWNNNNSDVEIPFDLEQPDYSKL